MATISRFRAVVSIGRAPGRGLRRLADVAGRPPRVPDRVQEPHRRRWPTGPSRSSGAAGASARSPSSRCSPAPARSSRGTRNRLPRPTTSNRRPRDDEQWTHVRAAGAARADAARGGRDARPALLRDRCSRPASSAPTTSHIRTTSRSASSGRAAQTAPLRAGLAAGGRLGLRHQPGGDGRRSGARRPPARPQRGVRAHRRTRSSPRP